PGPARRQWHRDLCESVMRAPAANHIRICSLPRYSLLIWQSKILPRTSRFGCSVSIRSTTIHPSRCDSYGSRTSAKRFLLDLKGGLHLAGFHIRDALLKSRGVGVLGLALRKGCVPNL